MRTRSTSIGAVIVLLALGAVTSLAAVTVTNVTTSVSPERIVTISYELASPSAYSNTVAVSISTNSGETFFNTCTNFTGDVGHNVAAGTDKQILWNAMQDTLPTNRYPNTRVRVMASDSMVLIPAGAFNMGTNNLPYENEMENAGPNHSVYISAFLMDKYEVTSQQWLTVRTWAVSNGYSLNAGAGKAPNHPVQNVNWYDCVKWCNARSQMEGRTPCYYTSSTFTPANLYTNGNVNISSAWVNWSANGYRLPTEAEWEKAARGGLAGMRFPWNDLNITHTNANYYSSTDYAYDTSATRGYHQAFNVGGTPYTSPVGYFAPNGYGLYDMAGNVFEWCWDRYDANYYSSSPGSDPTGPTIGSRYVLRGGGWRFNAYYSRVASRNNESPNRPSNVIGFRTVCR